MSLPFAYSFIAFANTEPTLQTGMNKLNVTRKLNSKSTECWAVAPPNLLPCPDLLMEHFKKEVLEIGL